MNKNEGQETAKITPVRGTNAILAGFSAKFAKYFDSMATQKLNFRPAFVYEKAGRFSIIFYWRESYNLPLIRFRKTFNLNRIPDERAKRIAAKIMSETVTDALAKGWNPLTDEIQGSKPANTQLPLANAVAAALDSKLLRVPKKRSQQAYISYTKNFTAWFKREKLAALPVSEFTAGMAQQYQDYLIKIGLSPVTINTRTEYISALFKLVCKINGLSANPFAMLDKLKEVDSTYYKLFTPDELSQIKRELVNKSPGMWQFFLFIFYGFMRPGAICHLRAKDIDFKDGLIFIAGENEKNGKDTYKQLLPPHAGELKPYIKGLKPDTYLFSHYRTLEPGDKPLNSKRVSAAWKYLIIDGLGIDKKLYGAKHTGAAMFLDANKGKENIKWLQMQMHHADLQTTSIYTNKLKVVLLDETAEIPKIV